MVELDFSSFPWTHPAVFTQILLYSDSSSDILNARAVCQEWRRWFETETIWTKYLNLRKSRLKHDLSLVTGSTPFFKHAVKYRIERLLDPLDKDPLTSLESMKLAIKIEKCIRQLKSNLTPKFSVDTSVYISELQEAGIKSIGPISLFIRIKVASRSVERILTELLSKYLTSIIVDKAEKENQKLQIYLIRAMSTGQNWVFRHFKPPPPLDNQAEIYSSLEEAMSAELINKSTKKSANLDEKSANSSENAANSLQVDDNGTGSLKRKRDGDDEEDLSKKQKIDEEETSIYSVDHELINNQFPTILDLLDIDHPIVEEALKSKFNIDKILVVPVLESFILHQDKYPELIQNSLEVIGRDLEGKVSKINPEKDFLETDTAVVGYMDNLNSFDVPMGQLMFWGGRDIRSRWSEFSAQLDKVDSGDIPANVPKPGRMNLPVLSTNPSSSSSSAQAVADAVAAHNNTDLEALMAARGITISRK